MSDKTIFLSLVIIFILNVIDAGATLHWVSLGASELNPYLNFFLAKSQFAFMIAKSIPVLFFSFVFWVYREQVRESFIQVGITISLFCYSAITIYHGYVASLLLF